MMGADLRKVGEDGIFRHRFVLEKDAFILYRVERILPA
jgi:hypothetical protein